MPIEAFLWSLLLVFTPALAPHIWPKLRERFEPLPFDLETLAPWIHSLGLPYLGLVLGSVSSRHVGLIGFPSASWLSGGLACILGLGAANFALGRITTRPDPERDYATVLLEEARWAFYRGAAAQWIPIAFSPLLGFGLAILELAIAHLAVHGLHPPSSMQWKTMMRAALSSLLFIGTGNVWLTVGTQLLLIILLKRKTRHVSPQ
jgi:hypothetical protein